KINDTSSAPIFHDFDPEVLKADTTARTLIAYNIPLFIKGPVLQAALAKYGTILKCKLTTPRNSIFQKATITYSDPAVVDTLSHKWSIWCSCQCIKIAPASFTKVQ